MSKPFEVTIEPCGTIVRGISHGVFNMEQAHAFTSELRSLVERLRLSGRRVGLLIDVRRQGVNPQEVGDYLRGAALSLEADVIGIVILVGSALHAMQANRLSKGVTKQRVFSDNAAAVAWLHEAG